MSFFLSWAMTREQRKDSRNYKFGGFSVTSTNLLLLISELEGSSQHLKYMGFGDDMNVIDEMKKRYYKLYFKTMKEEKANNPL
jgi:hypothetical protein